MVDRAIGCWNRSGWRVWLEQSTIQLKLVKILTSKRQRMEFCATCLLKMLRGVRRDIFLTFQYENKCFSRPLTKPPSSLASLDIFVLFDIRSTRILHSIIRILRLQGFATTAAFLIFVCQGGSSVSERVLFGLPQPLFFFTIFHLTHHIVTPNTFHIRPL